MLCVVQLRFFNIYYIFLDFVLYFLIALVIQQSKDKNNDNHRSLFLDRKQAGWLLYINSYIGIK